MIKLVRDGEYKFVVDKANYENNWYVFELYATRLFRYFKEILRSNTPHAAKIYRAIKRNPIIITETVEKAFDLVDRGGYIFSTQEDR